MLGARAVPSALAIGAMIPDAWYIVPLLERDHGHELPGALLFCIPAGLLAYMAFHLIFKQPLLALAARSYWSPFSEMPRPCRLPMRRASIRKAG